MPSSRRLCLISILTSLVFCESVGCVVVSPANSILGLFYDRRAVRPCGLICLPMYLF
jgi:hypothetical protein